MTFFYPYLGEAFSLPPLRLLEVKQQFTLLLQNAVLLRDERQILVLAAVSLLQLCVQTLQLGRDLRHLPIRFWFHNFKTRGDSQLLRVVKGNRH